MFLPPATSVLFIVFSRNHNAHLSFVFFNSYLLKVSRLSRTSPKRSSRSTITSDGLTYPLPTHQNWRFKMKKSSRLQKLIKCVYIFSFFAPLSCGHFISCIMEDYVAGLLGSSEGVAGTWTRSMWVNISTFHFLGPELELTVSADGHRSSTARIWKCPVVSETTSASNSTFCTGYVDHPSKFMPSCVYVSNLITYIPKLTCNRVIDYHY